MAARIRSLVNGINALDEVSRDDLAVGDVITVQSLDVATTYAWTIAYKPAGSTATFSGSPTAQNPGTFTVDLEGPYLIRLTVDLGLATESTQFVRLRYLTELGSLTLVAAGEQNAGSLPVPVDITPTGWADEQNANLLALLDLISTVSASGRIYFVDSDAEYGDYSTIQAAINAAVIAGATATTPWVIAVRPGTYTEDIAFAAHVHVVGWPGTPDSDYVVRLQCANGGGTGTHTAALANAGDRVILSNLVLVNVDSAVTNAVLVKSGAGTLNLFRCKLNQAGVSATVGRALEVGDGVVTLTHCEVFASNGAFVDRYAMSQSGGILDIRDSKITGTSGAVFGGGTTATLTDTRITSTGGAGAKGIYSDAESLTLEYCRVNVATGDPLDVHSVGGAIVTDVGLTARWSFIEGDLVFDTTGMAGNSSLYMGSLEYSALSLPGGSPTNFAATTKAASLFYDNTTSGMTAENVQDAIDETYAEAILVRTLDDAYDGGVAGGIGRQIVADSGPVEILDAVAPADPPDPSSGLGGLRATGKVEVGAIGYPELDLDPNPYGNGPMFIGGQRVWADNAPHGSTFFVQSRALSNKIWRNYNLRLQTESTDGGGIIGWVILRAGDSLPDGAAPPDGGPVFMQAGSAFDGVTGDGGDAYIAPGYSNAGTTGSLYIIRPQDGTAATLTAAGAFVGGVTGTVRFATDMGAIEVDIDAADNLAAVLVKLNATNIITAADSGGGVIRLTTRTLGPTAEIFYLNDSTGGTTDIALGVFDGQAQVDGTWPSYMQVDISAANEITFGAGGAVGPMIYNADTGKLTVPGLIDPTGVVFTQAGLPVTAAGEGAIFVSDGTGGLTADRPYFGPASAGAALMLLSSGTLPPGGTGEVTYWDSTSTLTGDANFFWDTATGRLGVNQATPDRNLHVAVSDAATNTISPAVRIEHLTSGAAAAGFGTGIEFELESDAGNPNVLGAIYCVETDATDTAEEGALVFYTADIGDDGLVERVRIDHDGNLIVGTPTPVSPDKLHVLGNATIDGKLTVTGLIDPTGIIFTEAAPPSTAASEGAVFVGDGTGGTVANHLYYREASDGSLLDLSAATSAAAGIREVVATPDAVAATDKILLVNVGGAAVLNLPAIATYTGPGLRIKDYAGIAAASNITINAAGGETIDGAASVVLTTNYIAIDLIPYGTNWAIL